MRTENWSPVGGSFIFFMLLFLGMNSAIAQSIARIQNTRIGDGNKFFLIVDEKKTDSVIVYGTDNSLFDDTSVVFFNYRYASDFDVKYIFLGRYIVADNKFKLSGQSTIDIASRGDCYHYKDVEKDVKPLNIRFRFSDRKICYSYGQEEMYRCFPLTTPFSDVSENLCSDMRKLRNFKKCFKCEIENK